MFHCSVVSISDTGFCMAQYGSNCHVAKTGPNLIVLPPPSKFWNNKHSLTCLAQKNISHLFFISWGLCTYLSVYKHTILYIQRSGTTRESRSSSPPWGFRESTPCPHLEDHLTGPQEKNMLGPEDMCYFSSPAMTFISFLFIKYPPCLTFT